MQKTETVKESMQGELNLKNQIAKRNEDLVKQQETELRKLTVSHVADFNVKNANMSIVAVVCNAFRWHCALLSLLIRFIASQFNLDILVNQPCSLISPVLLCFLLPSAPFHLTSESLLFNSSLVTLPTRTAFLQLLYFPENHPQFYPAPIPSPHILIAPHPCTFSTLSPP